MTGFSAKVLIADTVAPLVDSIFALEHPTLIETWLGALGYTIQLYFDFAGYSHMAIGLGLMMGFKFIENFNAPYISRSITEFWQRWHISLSTWLKDYLYIPLGGNRKGTVRTYINLLLTMVLGGLWHGANWTFLLWGTWHGLILVIERALGVRKKTHDSMRLSYKLLFTGLTFILVMLGWVVFRADTIRQAFIYYQGMAGLNGFGLTDYLSWQISKVSLTALLIGTIIVFIFPWGERRLKRKISTPQTVWEQIGMSGLFTLAVIKLLAQSYSPFLYFQF